MKRVLLIKFTSLGDLIHALPALTDASLAHPGLTFDWMIDESFAEVAKWHKAVDQVFTTSHRTWRKQVLSSIKPVARLIKCARKTNYDLVIDGQGNFKTALMTLCMRGPTAGFDRRSAREWAASFAYKQKHPASRKAHAIDRLRQLFALSLRYPLPATPPDFGIDRTRFAPLSISLPERYLVFIHSAAWKTKLWSEEHGAELVRRVAEKGYTVFLPWGNEEERARALRLAVHPLAVVLPKMSLSEIGTLLLGTDGCVSMDTGLSHLAAALNVPSVTLYGATDSGLIGTSGQNQIQLQAKLPCAPCAKKTCRYRTTAQESPPCLAALTPQRVFGQLMQLLSTLKIVSKRKKNR